jgi:hypothetical protein
VPLNHPTRPGPRKKPDDCSPALAGTAAAGPVVERNSTVLLAAVLDRNVRTAKYASRMTYAPQRLRAAAMGKPRSCRLVGCRPRSDHAEHVVVVVAGCCRSRVRQEGLVRGLLAGHSETVCMKHCWSKLRAKQAGMSNPIRTAPCSGCLSVAVCRIFGDSG